jgi:protein-disulfide isomerase
VGGAERNARKKRQAQLAERTGQTKQQPAGPAPKRSVLAGIDRWKLILGAVAVIVVVGVVVGGVIYTNAEKNYTEGKDIHRESEAIAPQPNELTVAQLGEYPAVRQDGVVVVGQEDAAVIIDVYEDFLCPSCRAFEMYYGKQVDKQLRAGTVKVRYHMLPMLNDQSDPAGYSMDAANASLCAADAGVFPAYHLSLFRTQPKEGARGWDTAQLTKLGKDLGATDPAFAQCVSGNRHDSQVDANFAQVREAPYLQRDGGFGTPTIAVGRKVIDIDPEKNPRWLDKLVRDPS